jgi:alanyl-tRNA synthetase
MPRKLTEIEEGFVINEFNKGTDLKDIADKLEGIGVKTVLHYLEDRGMPVNSTAAKVVHNDDEHIPDVEELEEQLAEETEDPAEKRREKLRQTKLTSGKLMAKDIKKGVTVMTEQASEMADARLDHQVAEATERQKEKAKQFIHKPFGDGPPPKARKVNKR